MTAINLEPPDRAHFLRGKLGPRMLYSRIGQLLKMVEARNRVIRELRWAYESVRTLRRRVRALEKEVVEYQAKNLLLRSRTLGKEQTDEARA